jgi:hypothetical protein
MMGYQTSNPHTTPHTHSQSGEQAAIGRHSSIWADHSMAGTSILLCRHQVRVVVLVEEEAT